MTTPEVRVLVTGSRHYTDDSHVAGILSSLLRAVANHAPPFDRGGGVHARFVLIQGGACGADRLARRWAAARPQVRLITERADGQRHGRAAVTRNNQHMLDTYKPDVVVAFNGGRNTTDMVAKAHRAGTRVVWATRRPATPSPTGLAL